MNAAITRKPRGKPVQVHDRRTTDKLKDAQLAPQEVDDPFEVGAKITVMRSVRNDPLANLHSRGSIDEAQYIAGRTFQWDWEKAERGPRAIDPGKEAVDGGRIQEPITEAQREATARIAALHKRLGPDLSAIAHDVLIYGRDSADVAAMRGLSGRKWNDYFMDKLRESLDIIAEFRGLSNGSRSS